MTFPQWAGKLAMKAFIGAVIVLGFFGPYVISIILCLVCLASWFFCRKKHQDSNTSLYTKHGSRRAAV